MIAEDGASQILLRGCLKTVVIAVVFRGPVEGKALLQIKTKKWKFKRNHYKYLTKYIDKMENGMKQKILRLSFLGIFFISIVGFASPSQALIAEAVVGTALEGAAGVAIVDRLEHKFQSINAQAQATANIATGNALIAIESVLGGLRQAFSEERQATFDSISNERKALIIQVYDLLDKIERGVTIQRGYLKADAVDLMNGVHLLTEKVRFIVTDIDPVAFAWREGGNYDMQLLGVGLGLPSATQNYKVKVEINGTEINPENLSPFVNMLKIRIPDSIMNAKFAEREEIRKLPIKITSTHTVKCGFMWLDTCTEPYSLKFDVKLYPRVAGTVVIKQTRPRSILVNRTILFTNEIGTGDHHNKPEVIYGSGPITAPPGWRVTRAWYDPNQCRPARPDGENTCVFFSGGTCTVQGAAASCTVAQASHPKIFRFTYEIAEEKTVPEELPPSDPLSLPATQAQSIRFDRNSTLVSLDAKLADGRSGKYMIKPSDSSPTPLLTCGQIAHLASDVSQADCWINLLN